MGDKDAPRTPRGTLTTVRARAGYQIHQDPAGSAKHPRFIPHATVRAIATEEHQTSWDWTDLPGVIVHKITKSVWLKRKPFQQSPTRNKWYCSKEPWWPIFIQMTFCPFMLKWNVCVCASSHVSLHLLALTFNLVGSSRSSNLGPEYESRQQFCSHARTLIRRATFFYNSFRIEHDVQSMLLWSVSTDWTLRPPRESRYTIAFALFQIRYTPLL